VFDGLTIAHIPAYGTTTYLADNDAVIFEDGTTTKSLTWRQLDESTSRLANHILSTGPRRRHIALLFQNSLEFVESVFAVAKADCVAVVINARLTGREIDFCFQKADVDLVLSAHEFKPVLDEVVSAIPRLGKDKVLYLDGKEPGGIADWRLNASLVNPELDIDPDSNSTILFTSGTTGSPKAGIYTHRRLSQTWDCFSREMCTSRHDRVLIAAPMYAGLGMNFAIGTLYLGGSALIVHRFDPEVIIKAIDKHKPTMTPLAPTMYYILNEAYEKTSGDMSSVRTCLSLGSSLTPPVRGMIQKLFPSGEIYELYGSTETGPTVMLHPEDGGRHIVENGRIIYSVGQAVMGVKVRLLDDDGNDVPIGEVGEIYKKNLLGTCVYYKNPELTASIYRGEWLTANDLGRQDKDGHVYIIGRKKDMIVTGGLNVYASDVEEVLSRFPNIGMLAVVGFPHEKWGEAVTAVIQGREADYSVDALKQHCKENLADYKRPREFVFVDALPLTPSGKIEKYKLADLFYRPKESA